MAAPHRPADAAQVADVVRAAAAAGTPLALRAGGTKDRLGGRVSGDAVDLSALAGVVTYEPEELILIARPATPLAQVADLLATRGQHLAFEPPHWGPGATLGGTLAVGAAGPRRFVAGAARDFVLGVEWIDGRGRRLRSGGRVVKNVTGFDLWRALVGSHGTLGVLTEVCLKLWPRPETERTLVVRGLPRADALARLRAWVRRPEAVTGLAWTAADGAVWARVEGSAAATAPQAESLRRDAGGGDLLDAQASARLWAQLREAGGLTPAPGLILYRIVVPPSRADDAVAALDGLGLEGCTVDWAGGLVWARLPATRPPAAVHALAGRLAGVAQRLGSGPDDANDEAFSPLGPGLAGLNERLRRTCDPESLFNPGRLGRGGAPAV